MKIPYNSPLPYSKYVGPSRNRGQSNAPQVASVDGSGISCPLTLRLTNGIGLPYSFLHGFLDGVR